MTATASRTAPPATSQVPALELDEQFDQPQPSRSPAILRNNQLAATVALLLFALVAIGQVLQLRSDLAERPQLTARAVHISQLQAELVRAGRIAATSALGAQGTSALDASLAKASGLVVRAAAAGADAEQLATANASLGTYGHLLRDAAVSTDAARTTSLLAQAESVRADSLQPVLEKVQAATGQQAAEPDWLSWGLALGGVAVLAVIGWGWNRTSRLSHRVINPGLAVAAVLVVGMTVLVVNVVNSAGSSSASPESLAQASSLQGIQTGVEESARLQAGAVIARQFTADQAKAEAAARQAADKAVDNATPDDVRRASSTAVDNLKDSAALLTKASWAPAAAALLGTDGTNLPKNLDALATASETESSQLVQVAADAPNAESTTLVLLAVGIALLAVVAAVAVDWGIGARLKEYQ